MFSGIKYKNFSLVVTDKPPNKLRLIITREIHSYIFFTHQINIPKLRRNFYSNLSLLYCSLLTIIETLANIPIAKDNKITEVPP